MSKQQRRYTEEFKQEAVRLALQSESISQVSNDLGIPNSTLFQWVNKYSRKSSSKNEPSLDAAALYEENRRLNKELSKLREEKEILKKAATYFAQESK